MSKSKNTPAVKMKIEDAAVGDKLVNIMAGLGTDGDKASHTKQYFEEIDWQTLTIMYASDWMARKVVDLPVDDMMGKPRIVSAPSLMKEDEDKTQLFTDYSERKNIALDRRAKKVIKWGRLYGGAAIIMGVEGAGKPEEPLVISRIPREGLKFLHVVSRHKLSIHKMDKDALSETYDQPLSYRLEGGKIIHASRVVAVRGIELPEELNLLDDFWGVSVLQHTSESIRWTNTILAQLASMVFEANVDTIAVKGLSQSLATKSGQQKIIERFRVGNRMKSTHQMMLYDMDMEEYNRNPLDVGKFPELVPSYMSVVSGASEIPATRFLGKSPDGMNATGNSDDRMYLDKLEDMRRDNLSDIYDAIDPVILQSVYGKIPEDWDYTYPNLWNIDAKDESEVNNKNAMTDQILLTIGAVNEYHISDRVQKSGIYPALTEEDVLEVKKQSEFTATNAAKDLESTEDDEDVFPLAEEEDQGTNASEEPEAQGDHPLESSTEDVAKQALNGAQIKSMVDIAVSVAAGDLSRDAGIAIVMVSIPGITEAQAGEIVGFEDEDKEPSPAPPVGVPLPVPPTQGANAPEDLEAQGEGNEDDEE